MFVQRNKLYSAVVAINAGRPATRWTRLRTGFGWSCPFTQRGEWPPGHYTLRNEVVVGQAECWSYGAGTDSCFRDPECKNTLHLG